jgi:hypothetical protein
MGEKKNSFSCFYYMIMNLIHDYSFGRMRDSWFSNYNYTYLTESIKLLYDNG